MWRIILISGDIYNPIYTVESIGDENFGNSQGLIRRTYAENELLRYEEAASYFNITIDSKIAEYQKLLDQINNML